MGGARTPMTLRLAINGKFLSAAPTGVHRVAGELANALADLAAEQPKALDIELWLPRDGVERAASIRLPARVLRPFKGIPWEQITAARHHRDRLLLNLCNIAPVARANAVTMIHDVQVHSTPDSYARGFRMWYKLVQPRVGRCNQRILTVSEYSRREIARVGICPLERITVIPNGVDHMLRVAPERGILLRLGLQRGNYVVALATVQAHKNLALLMRAFADPLLADARLVLVGGDRAEDFAARGIAVPANAIFAGRVGDGELRALYEDARCLAFPSRTEGFGLPPLEAMLLGCPTVVAPCGALPEVCGEAALHAGPDRPEEWISHIRALADQPQLRNRYAAAGRARAGLFTWRAAAERLVDALRSLRAQGDAGPATMHHADDRLSPNPGSRSRVHGNV